MDIISIAIAKKFTTQSIEGITGTLAGKNCTIESATKQDGRTTIVFKWTADNGDVRTTEISVDDGTPIYVWQSGESYKVGDLAIKDSAFYQCITANSDVIFDPTKWLGIGAADSDYSIVQEESDLPTGYGLEDRKMFYSIEDSAFFLWDGTDWVKQLQDTEELTTEQVNAILSIF